MKNLRKVFIKRKVRKMINDKEVLVGEWFPVSVNSAVPFNHRMLR